MEKAKFHAGGDIKSNASVYYSVKYHYTSMGQLEKYSTRSKSFYLIVRDNGC